MQKPPLLFGPKRIISGKIKNVRQKSPADVPHSMAHLRSRSRLLLAARTGLARAVRTTPAIGAIAALRNALLRATLARFERVVHSIGSGCSGSDGRQQDQYFFHV